MSPRHALIGHTGFVGSNLDRQADFSDRFNTKNVAEIDGQHFDLVVCAGVQAVKWWSNQNPAEDWDGIQALLDRLANVTADRFIHISTVDVYPKPIEVSESDDPHGQENHAYGRHRLAIEDFIRERFGDRAMIVRLPALFGPGLKKNVIYDLMHDNRLEKINPEGSFQWYDLNDLWSDLTVAQAAQLDLVNFATEPVTVTEIIEEHFPAKAGACGAESGPPGRYDFRTDHAAHWNSPTPYLRSKQEILTKIGAFIRK